MKIAQEVFLEEGFAAASMSTIAARLGGSKGTLYNYFKSKDELFAAYVQDACSRVDQDAFRHGLCDDEPVEVVLQQVGEGLLNRIYSPWAVDTFRVLVAEAKRAPELGRMFYEAGPAVGRERIAAYFARAVKRGVLVMDDYGQAVDQFIGLCRGDLHFRLILNQVGQPSAETVRADVAAGVRIFMKAYAPAKATP